MANDAKLVDVKIGDAGYTVKTTMNLVKGDYVMVDLGVHQVGNYRLGRVYNSPAEYGTESGFVVSKVNPQDVDRYEGRLRNSQRMEELMIDMAGRYTQLAGIDSYRIIANFDPIMEKLYREYCSLELK